MKQSVETVHIIPLAQIDDFPDHPFQVKNDEGMEQLVRSIEMNGVLTPVVVRQKEDGRYELISGHRRKYACGILGVTQIPIESFPKKPKLSLTNMLGADADTRVGR